MRIIRLHYIHINRWLNMFKYIYLFYIGYTSMFTTCRLWIVPIYPRYHKVWRLELSLHCTVYFQYCFRSHFFTNYRLPTCSTKLFILLPFLVIGSLKFYTTTFKSYWCYIVRTPTLMIAKKFDRIFFPVNYLLKVIFIVYFCYIRVEKFFRIFFRRF